MIEYYRQTNFYLFGIDLWVTIRVNLFNSILPRQRSYTAYKITRGDRMYLVIFLFLLSFILIGSLKLATILLFQENHAGSPELVALGVQPYSAFPAVGRNVDARSRIVVIPSFVCSLYFQLIVFAGYLQWIVSNV